MLWTSDSLSFLDYFSYLSKGTRETSLIYITTQLSCYVNISVRLITGYTFHIWAWQKELFRNQFSFAPSSETGLLPDRERMRERESGIVCAVGALVNDKRKIWASDVEFIPLNLWIHLNTLCAFLKQFSDILPNARGEEHKMKRCSVM